MSMIQVRMQDNTLSQIDNFQNRVNASSRSDAIRRAIEIADMLSEAVKNGERVIIERRGGIKTQILIAGINK